MATNTQSVNGKLFTIIEQYPSGEFYAWSYHSGKVAAEMLDATNFPAILVMTENRYEGKVEPGEVK